MSLIRIAIVLSVAIMLLPTDEKRQSEVSGVAGATVERTFTFCDRNPSTCAAGREMWSTFVRKAEFGMELASKLVREQLTRGAGTEPSTRDSSRDWAQPPAAGSYPRIEPLNQRGTLTRTDAVPQWRGAPTGGASR